MTAIQSISPYIIPGIAKIRHMPITGQKIPDNTFSDRRLYLQIRSFINRMYAMQNIKQVYDKDEYIDAVCRFFNQPREMVLSKSRKRDYVMPRQVAQTILKRKTSMSLKDVGLAVGNTDHASVLHSMRTVKNLYQTDKEYRKRINTLLSILDIGEEIMKF